jgi:hypothetical protein
MQAALCERVVGVYGGTTGQMAESRVLQGSSRRSETATLVDPRATLSRSKNAHSTTVQGSLENPAQQLGPTIRGVV